MHEGLWLGGSSKDNGAERLQACDEMSILFRLVVYPRNKSSVGQAAAYCDLLFYGDGQPVERAQGLACPLYMCVCSLGILERLGKKLGEAVGLKMHVSTGETKQPKPGAEGCEPAGGQSKHVSGRH